MSTYLHRFLVPGQDLPEISIDKFVVMLTLEIVNQ